MYNYPMHITLLTYGSRGDFQPFLALALGLQKAGHSVRLATPGRFADSAARHSISFSALAGDPEIISARFNDAGTNPVRVVRAIRDYVYEIAPQIVREARAAIAGADIVVHSFLFTTGAHTFARETGIPDISVQTFPMFVSTRAFPNVAMANVPPGALSYFTHWVATQFFWYGGNNGMPSFRREYPQDFPKKLYWPFKSTDGRPRTPLVFAYSPTVLPRPKEWTASHIHIPGYFFLGEPDYAPPSALTDFLASGGPPVCISFGSMVNRDAERIGHVVLDALARTHQRGIILTGWGSRKPDEIPADVFYLDAVPHDWLFPRCNVIIHHGGAGTTAAGLRSGKPNIVVPFAGDQLFWGKRVAALGAGPPPIPVKELTAKALAAALTQTLTDTSMHQRAAELGKSIRFENGVETTVALIEQTVHSFKIRPG